MINLSRNRAVIAIKKGQPVWLNVWSTDCDGCSSQNCVCINSVQDIVDFESKLEDIYFWADGPFNYEFVIDPSERVECFSGVGQWNM